MTPKCNTAIEQLLIDDGVNEQYANTFIWEGIVYFESENGAKQASLMAYSLVGLAQPFKYKYDDELECAVISLI